MISWPRHTTRVAIPEPCHENWDQMRGADRQRFCEQCQNTVHDLSAMGGMVITTEPELEYDLQVLPLLRGWWGLLFGRP